MTEEVRQELLEAFSRAWSGADDPPALDRLRITWAEATAEERETFKKEI